MADISEKWSCPRCGATWIREEQGYADWVTSIHLVQVAHGKRCPGSVSLP